jgi:hypothetical protein
MSRFEPEFPLKNLVPASYNPRAITPDAISLLQESNRPDDNRVGCGRAATRGILADLLLLGSPQGGRRGPGADSS